MKSQAEIEKIKKGIDEVLDPVLRPGITYFGEFIRSGHGYSGSAFFFMKDGDQCSDEHDNLDDAMDELPYDEDLSALVDTIQDGTKVRFTFRKGEPMTMEPYTPAMLLEDIEGEMQRRVKQAGATKRTQEIRFFPGKKLKAHIRITTIKPEESQERESSYLDDDIEVLYNALPEPVEKMKFVFENGTLTVSASNAFPEIGIELLEEEPDAVVLDSSDLAAIYAFLESGEKQRIAKALEALAENAAFMEQAEGRYLNLIQARLNDPEATLSDFAKGMPTFVDIEVMMGKNISDKFISFSYMDDGESRFVVDFIGAVVASAIDIGEFIAQAKACEDEKSLVKVYESYAKQVRNALKAATEVYPDGWYGKICARLEKMKVAKVLFDHSSFDEANGSPVLREFMFFQNVNRKSTLYMDIHQSDTPDLTEIFWLLPKVPKTNWSDVAPEFPDSPLGFERSGQMRVGDFGKWEKVSRGGWELAPKEGD